MDSSAESQRRIEAPVALIERLDRDGHVLQSTLVYRWPMKIGRSFDADLVLDDPHMAPLHAELLCDEQGLHLKVGETINGALIGEQHVQAGQTVMLRSAQPWRLGATRLRVRLASDPVPPEQLLSSNHAVAAPVPATAFWSAVLPALIVLSLGLIFDQWLESNPGSRITDYLSEQLAMLAATLAWAMLWALGSKLFQGHLYFKQHLRMTLWHGVFWLLLSSILPVLSYTTSWSILSRVSGIVGGAVICRLVWAHLVFILPQHRKGLVAAAAGLFMGGVGLSVWLNVQSLGQPFAERYAAALPPPAWRLAPTQSPDMLIDDAKGMKASLDKLTKDGRDDEPDELLSSSADD